MFKKFTTCFLFAVATILIISLSTPALDTHTVFVDSIKNLNKAYNSIKSGDVDGAKKLYSIYNQAWLNYEDAIKAKSKQTYGDIEDKMGMVQFLFSQDPVHTKELLSAIQDLVNANENVLQEKYIAVPEKQITGKVHVKDLVVILQNAENYIKNGDNTSALSSMKRFSSLWLDVEGVILTKSQKIYNDAEKDMVAAKAYLSADPIQPNKAKKIIERMIGYMSQVSDNTSYSIVDVITIILREGLEALLVVIALLGFLKKSGNEDKKKWIFGGVIIGLAVSCVLAVIVNLLFTSGTFGNNNFLISGWTGVFAAVMLIYVSYWLHSKSNANEWQSYIQNKSSKALATGSLFSLGVLAFLAVFREGTETVLFYIGMASSVKLSILLSGIAIGIGILILFAFLMLKIGLRIPMRPFFIVSSILVFYLGLKFTGMGINGLQNASVLPASSSDMLPTISWLAIYPSWQSIIPQVILVLAAIIMILKNYIFTRKIRGDSIMKKLGNILIILTLLTTLVFTGFAPNKGKVTGKTLTLSQGVQNMINAINKTKEDLKNKKESLAISEASKLEINWSIIEDKAKEKNKVIYGKIEEPLDAINAAIKFKPLDVKTINKELKLLNEQLQKLLKLK